MRNEIDISFETMTEADRQTYHAMSMQFTLWLALNPAEQLTRANSTTQRFKSFRNALILGGGRCVSSG